MDNLMTKGVANDVKVVSVKICSMIILTEQIRRARENSAIVKNIAEATSISPLAEGIWSDMAI